MRMIKFVLVAATTGILLLGGQAMAGKSSLENGKKLFGDTSLGGSGNGQACLNCHADGNGLGNLADDKKLVKRVNSCITDRLDGKKIDGRSAEMRSLKMYLLSLGSK